MLDYVPLQFNYFSKIYLLISRFLISFTLLVLLCSLSAPCVFTPPLYLQSLYQCFMSQDFHRVVWTYLSFGIYRFSLLVSGFILDYCWIYGLLCCCFFFTVFGLPASLHRTFLSPFYLIVSRYSVMADQYSCIAMFLKGNSSWPW